MRSLPKNAARLAQDHWHYHAGGMLRMESRSLKRMNGCHKLQSVAAVQPPNSIESAFSRCQRCCREVNNWRKTCIEHASTPGTKTLIETRLRIRTCCSLTRCFCTHLTSVSDELLLRLSWLSKTQSTESGCSCVGSQLRCSQRPGR